MSKILDLQKRASDLLLQRQNDIDEKLIADMQTALKDTKSFVNQRVNIISNDMQQEIEQTQQDLNDSLKNKKTSIQADINRMEQDLSNEVHEMQKSVQIQIQSLKTDFQTLNGLKQEERIKKTLITSNIALISLACITLISSICLGYVSKSKYNDINEMQKKVDYLKSQGGSMITTTCAGKLCVELDPNVKENYALGNGTRPLGVVKEVR